MKELEKEKRQEAHRAIVDGIGILSVAVPGPANSQSESEIIHNSLRAAVAHAERKEWMDGLEHFILKPRIILSCGRILL